MTMLEARRAHDTAVENYARGCDLQREARMRQAEAERLSVLGNSKRAEAERLRQRAIISGDTGVKAQGDKLWGDGGHVLANAQTLRNEARQLHQQGTVMMQQAAVAIHNAADHILTALRDASTHEALAG